MTLLPIMYESFLSSISAKQWKRIGLKRRAGVCTPLFSVYSKKSIGIGELPDLKLLIDWCKSVGMSIVQLLPLNDTGSNFVPYDAQSGFALEPMYLCLNRLYKTSVRAFRNEIDSIRNSFPTGGARINYKIKAAKLGLLRKIYRKNITGLPSAFNRYIKRNQFWLRDYALFKAIQGEQGGTKWEEWPPELKERKREVLDCFEQEHKEKIRFHMWLQWQLFEQFQDVRKYARSKKVFLMGDLPFLPSRDSADVWSRPYDFKLELSSGAPPDAYFFKGQRWGMPPCHWERMAAQSYDYLTQRLKYAENFYDLLRADHVVGLFRLWSIPLSEPLENGGLNGFFDPSDENLWEERGRQLLSTMVQNTKTLISAEDLGTVPECSFRVLEEFAVPGVDVQRWMRDSEAAYAFKEPDAYRKNSMATISTHDTASFNAWWEYEAGTVYGPLFKRKCEALGIQFEEMKSKLFDLECSAHDRLRWKEEINTSEILARILNRAESDVWELVNLYRYSYNEREKFWNYLGLSEPCEEKSSPNLARIALEKVSSATSIFSIQLLQDWLTLTGAFKDQDSWSVRINFPGILNDQNWSLIMPISLEEMKTLKANRMMRVLNEKTNRV
ncbi:MAG: 4-alpha-glucanotransferase [Candidatus Omnitrophica bacterium]|nr:4-alpha-glucanotransferase [Candidatus Omnitrophota bacterium]